METLVCDPAVIEPLIERLDVSTLCAFSETCTTWRDAATWDSKWRALCIAKWPWLSGHPLGTIDWKQRFQSLNQDGQCDVGPLAFNIDDYHGCAYGERDYFSWSS